MHTCHNCNKSKSDEFPVMNRVIIDDIKKGITVKITNLETLNFKEKPYIVNPEIDTPKEHFEFNTSGEILGITERGEETIRICNLNDDTLIYRRKEAYENLLEIVKMAKLNNKNIAKDALIILNEKIKIKQKEENEYSLFWHNVAYSLEKLMSEITDEKMPQTNSHK